MSRYQSTNMRKVNKKKTSQEKPKSFMKYETTIYNKVPEKNSDMYFVATKGDRCDILADRFYGDAALWWFIARVNNLKTMNIPAGTQLRIPKDTTDAKGY